MIFLINISVFWILFSLQAILAFSNKSQKSARIELRNTFSYNIDTMPAYDIMYVWKISSDREKFTPEDYSKGFQAFNSDETYFIFTKRWTYFVNLYYWVGKETSLEDKKTVAKYAIIFHHLFSEIWHGPQDIDFSREYGRLETESFWHIFYELKGKIPPESIYTACRHNYLPLHGRNLYIVKGRETTRVKKVTFDLRWVKPNICIIIDPSGHSFNELYSATVWCGRNTNEKVRRRAVNFTKDFSASSYVDVITGVGSKYKNLIELLEDKRNNRFSDVDTSSDDKFNDDEFVKSRDESVKLFELCQDYPGGKREIEDRPIHNDIFKSALKSFLFDSKSIAGLSFITGYKTNVEAKIWAIQYAEDYLNSQIQILGRPIPMRIVFPLVLHFDFMINVINEPNSVLSNGDFELW